MSAVMAFLAFYLNVAKLADHRQEQQKPHRVQLGPPRWNAAGGH